MIMSQRQRQSPVSGYPSTFRSSIPRTSDLPLDFEVSYSSQVSMEDMQHFSLTSSPPRPQHFAAYMPGDYDVFPGMDDPMSMPISGVHMMNQTGTLSNISPPESLLDCTEVSMMARSTGKPSPPYSTSDLSVGPVYGPEAEFDILGPSYMDWQLQHPTTPPPESYLKAQLEDQYVSSEEPTVCEYLGVSGVQAYSKPRRSQPRPLRPSNERTQSMDSTEDSSSPKEDSPEKSKARSDPLYDLKPDKDGLYHCPKKTELNCNHKPTKQKCIFAKYLDSHLRPYLCRYASSKPDCEDLRFSSNACLFRHEREAHGMHNHGHNPFMCKYQDCERAKPGNGFPRRWNQRDHMKRVHGWNESQDNDSRRRHGPSSVPMKRSGSGGRPRGPQPYTRDARRSVTSSHAQMMYAPVPDYALPVTNALESFQFAPSPQALYYPTSGY